MGQEKGEGGVCWDEDGLEGLYVNENEKEDGEKKWVKPGRVAQGLTTQSSSVPDPRRLPRIKDSSRERPSAFIPPPFDVN